MDLATYRPTFEETRIAGAPRQRGRSYAEQLGETLTAFHNEHIIEFYERHGPGVVAVRSLSERCLPDAREHLPQLVEELEGMSEACGLSLIDLYAALCHEELFHGGIPREEGHCICFAVSTSDSGSGDSYTGQTWDWMRGTYGLSRMTNWQDESGRKILFYGYPAIPYGSGMNDRGLALTWHSGGLWQQGIPPTGLPAYALIYGVLQHDDIAQAVEWLQKVPHSGWFNFIMCDTQGEVACVEGAPGALGVSRSRGFMARHNYYHTPQARAASNQQDSGGPLVPVWHRESRMLQLLMANLGRMDDAFLQAMLCEHEEGCAICHDTPEPDNPDSGLSVDLFYFQPRAGRAMLARGPLQGPPGPFQEVCL